MKTQAIILLLLAGSVYANNSHLAWVDEQVKAIKPPRKGISNSSINRLSNPFIIVKAAPKKGSGKKVASTIPKKPKVVVKPLALKSVMNTSALIGSTWYKVNDSVRGYTLVEVNPSSVLLVNGKKHKKLFITQENSKINISVK